MVTYCLSDLHLHAENQPYLFTDHKEQVFAAILDEITRRGAALILAGDIFDLTGMTPPAHGLSDFFTAVLGEAAQKSAAADLRAAAARLPPGEQIAAVARRFPRFFQALQPLARSGRLRFIAGNHDLALSTDAGARGALAQAMGVPAGELLFQESHRVAGFLVAAHGNQFDESNRTDSGHHNRGAAITSSLYRGVMPALDALGVPAEVVDAIPAVRPEENIVTGVEPHLGAELTGRFLVAFVKLLDENGYFEGGDHIKVWLATHLAGALITPDRVRGVLADDAKVKMSAREGALQIIAGELLATPGEPPPRVVVLGHTHELDALTNYVNLGTWVDHVRGLSPQDLVAADRSLPVLCIEDQERAVLRDAATLLSMGGLDRCPELWRYRG